MNSSELKLKKLVKEDGLLGFDKVVMFAIDEWGKDIKRNQLPSILGGVGPMHSFIQLCEYCVPDGTVVSFFVSSRSSRLVLDAN